MTRTKVDPRLIEIGKKLREARDLRGLTLENVEERLNIGNSLLSKWERGECDPGLSRIIDLVKYYDVSLEWVAGQKETMNIERIKVDGETAAIIKGAYAEGLSESEINEAIKFVRQIKSISEK